MRVLIDIGHPAHVHLFKNLIYKLKSHGHSITVTVKNITSAKRLLESYKIEYLNLGGKSDNLIGKALRQILYTLHIAFILKKKKIDLSLGSSISIAQAGFIMGVPSIILDDDDDDVEPLFVKFGHRFSTVVLSPEYAYRRTSKKQCYKGFHELAYLHPKWFKPNPKILDEFGLISGEPFFILRFNAFKAHHDAGVGGLSYEQKGELISNLKLFGKIFITTEREIESEFSQYKIIADSDKMHHLLYYATMFIGDSQTMTSEAAILGTPAIRCNTFVGRIGYLEKEEKDYGLTYGFQPNDFNKMLSKIQELLNAQDLKKEWGYKRESLLKENIDLSLFLIWYVENFPASFKTMNENPLHQIDFISV